MRRLARPFHRLPLADQAAWICLIVATIGAAALIATRDTEEVPPAGGAAPGATADVAERARVAQDTPLVLGTTEARAIDARASAGSLIVRVRLRNETGAARLVGTDGQRLNLLVDDSRIPATAPRISVADGSAETVSLRFPLDDPPPRVELEVSAWTDDQAMAADPAQGVIAVRVSRGQT